MENDFEKFKLMHDLLSCRDFHEILDTGRKLFCHPLILCDLTFRLLAMTDEPDITDEPWVVIRENGGIPMSHAQTSETTAVYRRSIQEKHCITEYSDMGVPPMLRRALCADRNRIMGYLDSPCYDAEDFTDEEKIIFDVIGDMCALRMEKDLHYSTKPEDMKSFFISDLLAGRITTESVVRERLRYFHMELKPPIQIITIKPLEQPKTTFQFHDACQEVAAHYPSWISFEYDRSYKMIASSAGTETFNPEHIAELEGLLKERGLAAGVCRPLMDLTCIAEFNAQSEKALELGRIYHPESFVHMYDDLSIFHALAMCADSGDVLKLCHSAIYILGSYDRDHDTCLLETLEVYLRSHMSVPEAANRLSIHRNTMSYRLNKINELIDLNLDNSETVFHLLFSYHILEYESHMVMKDAEEQSRRKPKRGL